ncbi:hypothetical protein DASC09_023090 [Saccharomycopsis crataegensis]|uniref:Cytosolic endo-beta-N-acetylglucosaminidase TIM barrel domain-containing protein n=1 Tax=Saccharomycopsis crataegensis TaxID=43959 RepID=A0AAV5QK46_9ASCO|nr:hypothetical protein DASC09_023090 [Saccharomycopsis crataegensis]
MFSHARVSRRLSRRGSTQSNHQSIDLRDSRNSRAPSVYSQAATISDTDSINGAPDLATSGGINNIAANNFRTCIDGLYLNSLEELSDWYSNYDQINDNLYDSFRIPRQDLAFYKRSTPKSAGINLSVCHDFKGNYVDNEDLSPLGYFPHPNGLHYFLQFPSLVNHFIYFSHNMISVPTVSWINNCHKFGIDCMGTIIIEGNTADKFRQLSQLCCKNQNHEYIYIKMLVKLYEHYKFDGYLINIETRFLNRSESFEIITFVEQLRASIHSISPRSKVIWYDSFIPELNKIKYENGVSPLNYELFKSSDYFLTNYWWDESILKKNVAIAGLHGINSSLYVGIDMFGRGSKIGNGGYDVPIAVNFCKEYDSNVCLFAPAWTYEFLGKDNFLKNDAKLWKYDGNNDTIATYIDAYGACCFYPFANNHSKKQSFLFYSNFSKGQGKFFAINGKTVFNNYWVNSNFQYEIPDIVYSQDTKSLSKKYQLIDISIDDDESFVGGSCLKIVKNNSQLILSDSDKLSDIDRELKSKRLFNFGNDCSSENIRIRMTYKYNIVNKDFQFSSVTAVNESDKESFIDNLKSNISEIGQIDGYFQLELKYRIERRYKSIYNIRDGVLEVPLDIGRSDIKSSFYETDWKTIEMTFPTPRGVKWEYCILDSVNVSWVSNQQVDRKNHNGFNEADEKIFANVYKLHDGSELRRTGSSFINNTRTCSSSTPSSSESALLTSSEDYDNDDDEEWIILPDNSVPTSLTELYIGELSILSILDEDITSMPSMRNKIKNLESVKSLNPNLIYIKWVDFISNNLTRAAYWNIFINDEFFGVSFFNYWAIDLQKLADSGNGNGVGKVKSLKVRVDSVSVIGDIIQGDDIIIKL